MAVFGTAVFGTAVFGPADTTAPTVPGSLTATAINATRINLGWIASTDAVGVTGYVIRRGGSILTTVGAVTSYADTTVSPSTTYSYTVDAFDAAGNHSAQSSSASATTPASADTTAPSIPGNLTATATSSNRVTLAWNASTDNVGVTGYVIYRGLGVSRDVHLNGPEFGISTASGSTSSSFHNLNPGTIDSQYHYDSQASFNYLAGRGYRRVKLPIRWERIQPTLNAALNAAELTRLTSCLDRINTAGLKAILDVHNYGIYYLGAPGSTPVLAASGSGSTLLAGSYTIGYSWWNGSDSQMGPTQSITISAGQNIVMTANNVASGATSVNWWLTAAPATTNLGYLSGSGISSGSASYTLTSRTQGSPGSAPTGTGGLGFGATLGDSNLPTTAFSDLWTRLSTAFKTHGAITNGGAYCIMTEPQNSLGLTAATWKTASQAVVTAIRAVDTATCIHVCGFNWANTRNWTSINGSGTWITDPNNNLRYEAHCYFDDQVGGQYPNTYAQEVTNATTAGFTAGSNVDAEHTRIRADISGFQSWLSSNNVRGVLGEIGWPNTPIGEQAQWNALANRILSDCDTNAIETVAWQCGEWSTDKLTIYTGGFGTISTANAQSTTVEAHHSFVTPQLTSIGSASYADISVSPSTTYIYGVDAYDAAGNHSFQSAWAVATTPFASVGTAFAPSVAPTSPRLGPITSSLGTTYTSGQVTAMLFSPSLQVEWRWDLLDSQMNYKLDLTPLLASDHAPTISNDSTRAVKRQIEGLVMRADSRVNYFQDLIRPHFRLQSPDGGWLDWPRGIFMMTPPNREINEAVTWWTMVAPDLTQLLADASFDAAYSVSAGTGYTEAIATLLATYGGFTTLGYRAIASTTRLPVPSNWDAGTNYLKAINDLLAAISYVPAAMDGNLLVSEPQPDYTVQPADIILDAVNGPSIIIGPFTEQTDYSNAYNIVRVAGTDPRRQPVFGFYRNTRSDSPVSLFRWHPRTKVIQDSNLATDQAAQQRAITEAQSAARIFATFRIGLPPFPFFEDLDIVDLTYKSADDGLVSQSYLALHWAHPCTINQPTIVDLQRVVSF